MAQKKSTSEHIKNARRWQRRLEMWSESGQTQVEYCRVNNLGVKAFAYWLRKDRKSNNPYRGTLDETGRKGLYRFVFQYFRSGPNRNCQGFRP